MMTSPECAWWNEMLCGKLKSSSGLKLSTGQQALYASLNLTLNKLVPAYCVFYCNLPHSSVQYQEGKPFLFLELRVLG